jgi:hypothetical protein
MKIDPINWSRTSPVFVLPVVLALVVQPSANVAAECDGVPEFVGEYRFIDISPDRSLPLISRFSWEIERFVNAKPSNGREFPRVQGWIAPEMQPEIRFDERKLRLYSNRPDIVKADFQRFFSELGFIPMCCGPYGNGTNLILDYSGPLLLVGGPWASIMFILGEDGSYSRVSILNQTLGPGRLVRHSFPEGQLYSFSPDREAVPCGDQLRWGHTVPLIAWSVC